MLFNIEEISDEGLDFKLHIAKSKLEIDEEDCSLNKDVSVSGRLSRLDDDFYLNGNVNTELNLKCSRCLDPLVHPVDGKLKTHFMPPIHDSNINGEVELHLSDIDTETYKEKQIDLTQSIRDRILLTIPVTCLCLDNCRGICPNCGVKLNVSSCGCDSDSSIDPRLEVLKNLKNKL